MSKVPLKVSRAERAWLHQVLDGGEGVRTLR